jgi:endonuclease/exonuclease/phosphatase family metal-dependent hydrolase
VADSPMCDTARVTPAADGRSARPWTVTTWNVHGAGRIDVAAVASALDERSPDVAVLQEIRRRDARRLARRASMVFAWSVKHYPLTSLVWWRAEGLAVLTPHHLGAVSSTQISSARRRRWDWRRRIAQWTAIRRDGTTVCVFNVHLSPHADAPARRDEARRVAELAIAGGSGRPVVVAGDFNDADDASIVEILPGVEHVHPGPTNPAGVPDQTLDHVLLPADASDVRVEVPQGGAQWAALSDHLPVTVSFCLP